jgi:hypothetical protein
MPTTRRSFKTFFALIFLVFISQIPLLFAQQATKDVFSDWQISVGSSLPILTDHKLSKDWTLSPQWSMAAFTPYILGEVGVRVRNYRYVSQFHELELKNLHYTLWWGSQIGETRTKAYIGLGNVRVELDKGESELRAKERELSLESSLSYAMPFSKWSLDLRLEVAKVFTYHEQYLINLGLGVQRGVRLHDSWSKRLSPINGVSNDRPGDHQWGYSQLENTYIENFWSFQGQDPTQIEGWSDMDYSELETGLDLEIDGLLWNTRFYPYGTILMPYIPEHLVRQNHKVGVKFYSGDVINIDLNNDRSMYWLGGRMTNEVNDPGVHAFSDQSTPNVEYVVQQVEGGVFNTFGNKNAPMTWVSALDYRIYSRTNTLVYDKVPTLNSSMRIVGLKQPYDSKWFPYNEAYSWLNLIKKEGKYQKWAIASHQLLSPRSVHWNRVEGAEDPYTFFQQLFTSRYSFRLNPEHEIQARALYTNSRSEPFDGFDYRVEPFEEDRIKTVLESTRIFPGERRYYQLETRVLAESWNNHWNPGVAIHWSAAKFTDVDGHVSSVSVDESDFDFDADIYISNAINQGENRFGFGALLSRDYRRFDAIFGPFSLNYEQRDFFMGHWSVRSNSEANDQVESSLNYSKAGFRPKTPFEHVSFNFTRMGSIKKISWTMELYAKHYIQWLHLYTQVSDAEQTYPLTMQLIELNDKGLNTAGLMASLNFEVGQNLRLMSRLRLKWAESNTYSIDHLDHRLMLEQRVIFNPAAGLNISWLYRFQDKRFNPTYDGGWSTFDFYPSPWQRPLHLLNMRIDGNLMQNHFKGFIVLRNLLRGMESYDTFGEYYDLSVSVGFRIEAGL